MELGLGYKYVSKRHGFPSLVSIVDGHIMHLMTVNNDTPLFRDPEPENVFLRPENYALLGKLSQIG